MEDLLLQTSMLTPDFTIIGKFQCKIVKVYDADTVHCCFFPFGINDRAYKFHVRLNKIDSPELKSSDPLEKLVSQKLATFVSNLILDKICIIECNGFDKYGRILGNIFYNDIDVSDLLIQKEFVKQYGGGTKLKFDLDFLQKILNNDEIKNLEGITHKKIIKKNNEEKEGGEKTKRILKKNNNEKKEEEEKKDDGEEELPKEKTKKTIKKTDDEKPKRGKKIICSEEKL